MFARFLLSAFASLALSCAGGCNGADRAAQRDAIAPLVAAVFDPPREIPGVANFGVVSDGLWRGAQPTKAGLLQLRKMGVRTIVNLRAWHDDPIEVLNGQVAYYGIPSDASNPEPEKIAAFLKIVMKAENRPVFVHCRRGADRTGCCVAAWRMMAQGWSAAAAERELRAYRWDPIWDRIPEFLRRLDATAMWERVAKAEPKPAGGK